jgi:catechol 2,3-dioxygenase-like lactoylglutathione lyase family enzyme
MTDQTPLVPRIAGIEIPVSNLRSAVEWYHRVLGLIVIGDFQESWKEAMLQFAHRPDGAPGIYLVQNDSPERLKFHNTNHGYTQASSTSIPTICPPSTVI